MMREIKFRGLDLGTNQWLYGSLVTFEDGTHVICHKEVDGQKPSAPVKPESVGEFSGFKDKNGTDVYEGDWIRVCSGYISKVIYDEKQCAFLSSYSHPEDPEDLLLCDLGNEVEVVGNIHES